MPTYEYVCKVCDHQFEIQHSIKDDALLECPKCRVCALDRLINSDGGFILKGDCWHKDLYNTKKANND